MSHKVFYSKFFTPPKFLEMLSVSIEIVANGVYYFTVQNKKNNIIPNKFGFIEADTSNRELLIKTLINIKKITGVSFVRFSLPEEQTYIFKTHLPNLKTKEIRDVLDFKLEENIPLSSKEAVFDYDLIKSKNPSGGLDLSVSASPLKSVEEWQAIFKSANLIPTMFSPESQNIARSLVRSGNEQTLIIVNIREKKTILSLVSFGVVEQTSSIGFGGDNFTELLAKSYKLTLAEASKLKKEKLYTDSSESLEMFSQLINPVSIIKEEVSKFISYCSDRPDFDGRVSRVILCGHEAMMAGLSRYLSTGLDLPIEIANIWVNNFNLDDYIPSLSRFDSLDYATVNGLSLI